MNNTTLFVVNPISGDNNKASILKTIRSWAQSSRDTVEIWKTTGNNDKEILKTKINELQPHKVVAVGGDGTALLCASVIIHTKILLGIIPAGSANGMSSELNLPKNIKDVLKVIEFEKHINCDMLLFNDKHLGFHISDIGLNAGLVKEFDKGERRGFLGYAQGFFHQLSDPKTFKVQIKTESDIIEKECYMLAFGNASRYGTGALLNGKGRLNDGLMELSLVYEINLAKMAGQLFDIVEDDADHAQTFQCEEAEISIDRKVPFQIDGELQPDTDHIHVKLLPACLKLIMP